MREGNKKIMRINTLNLQQAADFLKMSPEGVRRLAVSQKIPAAKPGKCWCFLEEDLVSYLRSFYKVPGRMPGITPRKSKWPSISEIKSGGFDSITAEKEYNNLLELVTK